MPSGSRAARLSCRTNPTKRSRQRGFTLLEVAVAMAVLGLVLGTMMQVISGGLNLEYKAGRLARAVLRARALTDEMLSAPVLKNGPVQGEDDDGLRWRREVREATPEELGLDPESEDDDFADESEWTLKAIVVSVWWDESEGGNPYTVSTLRMVPADYE